MYSTQPALDTLEDAVDDLLFVLHPTPTTYTVLETACEACGEVNTHLTAGCPFLETARDLFPRSEYVFVMTYPDMLVLPPA